MKNINIKATTVLIFIFLAATSNAVMDNIKDHWYKSRLNTLNGQFWNPEIAGKNKYINYDGDTAEGKKPRLKKILFFDQPFTDAWHTFKSLMIVFLCFAVVSYKRMVNWYVDILIIGITWNLIFNLFYNLILIK